MGGSEAGIRYQIAIERGARRSLDREIDRGIVESIREKIDGLQQDPYSGMRLRGPLKGKYRITVRRDYRVVYRIDERQKLVIVEKIGHRSKVYK
ncbi:MAG: type II toxin-antitoxin system mRNA interferase toxin, RelE/StbE family [Candidatus Poribacteria bacterium]|nr:type II toxin-antitoxin system mRNA interferase toxin, RelE/StbE family [Candidatus Poribacteria bacterium]MDE0505910.1 type II toxin-antitoxin system mRNA interferase toxin, RelE/StbE family [Candidatus Poribacteria bacterium]